MISSGLLRDSKRGFTLVELIVTITILAILAAIAAPSFGQILAKNRMKSAAAELQSSITQARSFSAFLNRQVEVLPAYTGSSAGTSVWNLPLSKRTSIQLPNALDVSAATLDAAKLSWYVVTPASTSSTELADSTTNSYPVQVSLPDQTTITVVTTPTSAAPSALSGIRFFPAGTIGNVVALGAVSTPLTQVAFRVCDTNWSRTTADGYLVLVNSFGAARTINCSVSGSGCTTC